MVDWVRNTCVLCNWLISKVDLAVLINCYVLKKSVSLDSVVDVWFRFLVKVDDLCITSAFKVEDTVVIPTMLVVSDEKSLWICRKSCLTCSWETEEDSCILTVHICVCRAVHACNTLEWEVVVHHWEHTLLHFTTIPCVDDNLLTGCDVEYNSCLWVKSKFLVVFNLCLGCVVNNEIWLEVLEFFFRRLNEHVLYKVSLPSDFNDEADSHSCIFVCTAECIDNIEFLIWEFIDSDLLDSIPSLFASWMVVVLVCITCPPDCVLWILVHDNKLVFWRTSSINTSHDVDSTKLSDLTLVKSFKTWLCLFCKQLLVGRVVDDFSGTCDTISFQIDSHINSPYSIFNYEESPLPRMRFLSEKNITNFEENITR